MEDLNKKSALKDVNAKQTANLDEALEIAGLGWYNLKYCLLSAMLLISTIMEILGASLVLPAAICDLQMSDSQRGLVMSIPYLGMLITSFPWGFLVDTRGRKKMLIYSSIAVGILSILSGLMPNLPSFVVCKFLSSLCITCPSAASYTYIGEILPSRYRDLTLSVINATQVAGSALVPLLAWAILPLDFRVSFGFYIFRPWRLLTMFYASFFLIFGALLALGPESPKYLVTQDKYEEALSVLQDIYAGNKGKRPDEYPIKWLDAPPNERKEGSFLLSLKVQTVPLLKWPYLKWMLLNGSMLFTIFVILNGLNVWVPDVINRVFLAGDGQGRTACEVIVQGNNQTSAADAECDDTLDEIIFLINTAARLGCAVVAILISSTVKYIGKKKLVIICFLVIGMACISVNFITQDVLSAVILSSSPIIVLAVGPINAYTVAIFPTHLRGMAISLSMMLGRIGSVVGANFTGLLINNACDMIFYSFGGLLFLSSVLALLLPNSSGAKTDQDKKNINTR
ncbi:unnamed protein product [Arctia plantaginis]|uniref:Major facilitator superfamily (MFS) profile domain-containing protein n=1 Tax=Arctia plantaginis TaxID=874455 RepID=A0A8S0ZWA8_ARCPL|nr:unnamed protein product [Arctia plantaginis]